MEQVQADSFSASGAVAEHIASPALQGLLAHWVACRGKRAMPARDDLAEETLSEALHDLVLFELSCACQDETHDDDVPAAAALVSGMAASYHEVIRRGRPMYGRRHYARGGEVERLLLPLSRNGSSVDTILVGVQRRQ
ncbi:MAG: hypothetical protein L6R19_26685 [Alphaproteobacteria bacterium]|nr:hypothetical protein [Alphaproteobacteria bacterium]